jgi:hypothetical protein
MTVDFDDLWQHYSRTGLLYPDKLRALEPQIDRIRGGWPSLLQAPDLLFQVQVDRVDGRIASSLSTFRDPAGAYVVQHAASERNPLGMLACLRQALLTLEADPTARHIVFHSRPDNAWPARLIQTISNHHPEPLTSLLSRNYLMCDVAATRPEPAPDVHRGLDRPVEPWIEAAVGDVRARALGLTADVDDVCDRYAHHGVRRSRSVLAFRRGDEVAGIAIVQTTSVPLNLSSLDSRTEIIVRAGVPDRSMVVAGLAAASIREAADHGVVTMTLLADDEDIPGAVSAGFRTTGRQYTTAIWSRVDERGWHTFHAAIDDMYRARPATAGLGQGGGR